MENPKSNTKARSGHREPSILRVLNLVLIGVKFLLFFPLLALAPPFALLSLLFVAFALENLVFLFVSLSKRDYFIERRFMLVYGAFGFIVAVLVMSMITFAFKGKEGLTLALTIIDVVVVCGQGALFCLIVNLLSRMTEAQVTRQTLSLLQHPHSRTASECSDGNFLPIVNNNNPFN